MRRWVELMETALREGRTERELFTLSERVYHGSPHHFDQFFTIHTAVGEGAQSYGWGCISPATERWQNFTEINLTIKLRSTGTGRKWIKGYTIASRPNWRRSSTHGIKVYNQWPSVAVASRKELNRRRALARLRRIVVWIGFVLLIGGHR
jgi:hypothetical protein